MSNQLLNSQFHCIPFFTPNERKNNRSALSLSTSCKQSYSVLNFKFIFYVQEEQRMMLEEERRKREEFEKLQLQKETQLRGMLIFCFHFNDQFKFSRQKNV